MAKIFQFPEKKNENLGEHKWWHRPYVSKAIQYDDHLCYVCDKCNHWMISKDIAGQELVIHHWVDFETFQNICDGYEIANLKPRLVWFLQDMEMFFRKCLK